MKETSLKLACFVRDKRKELLLTQEQLAERSGIDYKHIQNLESFKKINDPKYSTLSKLAHGLEMSLIALIESFNQSYYNDKLVEIPQEYLLINDSKKDKKLK